MSRSIPHPRAAFVAAGLLALLGACQTPPADDGAKHGKAVDGEAEPAAATTGEPAAEPGTQPETASAKTSLERLFRYLPSDATGVAYDRSGQRFDPEALSVVFAIPPKTSALLDHRTLLDEGLDIVLDGDADPEHWLSPISLGFTLTVGRDPYFLRPLTKPVAELAPLLEQGFNASEAHGVSVWLPTGAFPWKIAILADDELAAFIPVDAMGTGVEPLLAATTLEESAIETQLVEALAPDPSLELVLVGAQPGPHFDLDQSIAQVQFGLRQGQGGGYEGQVVLAPTGDIDAAVTQLRARKHPEENLQIQALLGAVEFVPERGGVVGRLVVERDQLKHLVER